MSLLRPADPWHGVCLGVLLALLAVDATVILVVVLGLLDPADPPVSLIFDDGGVAEFLGHAKVLAGVVALGVAAVRARQAVFAAWALLFAVVVLDDYLMLHERWGAWLVVRYALPAVPYLRDQDTAEVLVWAVLGIVPALLVLATHLRSDPATRRRSLRLGVLFAGLLVVAVLLDMLVVATLGSRTGAILQLGEDGGELVILTLLVAYALWLAGDVETQRDGGRTAQHVPAGGTGDEPAGQPVRRASR